MKVKSSHLTRPCDTILEVKQARTFIEVVLARCTVYGASRETLARLVGIKCQQLRKIEHGEQIPMLSLILKFADALDCSVDKLMVDFDRQMKAPNPDSRNTPP